MCGILGILAPVGRQPETTLGQAEAMRDEMAQRGPDGAGLEHRENVIFAHRRLAVVDLEGGSQPMWSADGRHLLVYNGELYNDAELRAALIAEGVRFRTRCDTETVLYALAQWGIDGLSRLRGMFALGLYDFRERRLLLARDPLGIKPLYLSRFDDELVFASHVPALLKHPRARIVPNWEVVSAYLSTLRTTLGDLTLFDGVLTLRPGEVVTARFEGDELTLDSGEHWIEPPLRLIEVGEAVTEVRAAIAQSVEGHLRADVSRCSLLSGGLDSSIVATLCRDLGGDQDGDLMRTWCAGAREGTESDDFAHAALVSRHLGTDHTEVSLDRAGFQDNWDTLVSGVGLPVSTPNETAIYAVCRDLSEHATVVLSGEGADELFAGYAGPLLAGIDGLRAAADPGTWPGGETGRERFASELREQYGTTTLGDEVQHYLRVTSWVSQETKPLLFHEDLHVALGHDRALRAELAGQFARDAGVGPVERLLRVHRRVNLTGLLRRLDTASMLAGVEGRTPFADVRVAELALSLPVSLNLSIPQAADGGWISSSVALSGRAVGTKRLLRQAFADRLPPEVVARPKASFPLPFQRWLPDATHLLTETPALREAFRPDALATLAEDPVNLWQIAWPMMNIARWLRRWWPDV